MTENDIRFLGCGFIFFEETVFFFQYLWRRAQIGRPFPSQRLARASRPAHRRHGPQCRRAGARSTSVVATWANRCSSRSPQSQNTLLCRSTCERGNRTCWRRAGSSWPWCWRCSLPTGAGDDKPAEPCTKRRKTHMPLEVKEWFCSLARVKLDWTVTQCLRLCSTLFLSHCP